VSNTEARPIAETYVRQSPGVKTVNAQTAASLASAYLALEARCVALEQAALEVISLNLQHAKDECGDASRAEGWACVRMRAALTDNGGQAVGR